MNKRVNIIFIFVVAILIVFTSFRMERVYAKEEHEPMIIFLIDGLSFDRFHHWMEMSPALRMFVQQSEIGAMTMRTASGRALQNQLLTMATGVKTSAPAEILSFIAEEGAGIKSTLFHEWFAQQKLLTFGEILKRSGKSIEVISNSELWNRKRSLGALLASDHEGRVERAKIVDDNYELLKEMLMESDADVIVVDIADLRQVQQPAFRHDARMQREWTQKMDGTILDLLLWAKDQCSQHSLWIISPTIDRTAEQKKQWLTPLVYHSSKERRELLLSSPTTRQPGIVANVDLLPTWLTQLGIDIPSGLEGRPLDMIEGKGIQSKFYERVNQLFYIHKLRPDVLYQVISLQVILLIIVGAMGLYPRFWTTGALKAGHYILVYVLMVPFFFLLLGLFIPKWGLIQIHLYLMIGGGLIAYFLRKQKLTIIYVVISLLYVTLLFIDGLMDNYLMKRSFLGYDPIIGARYYGIGNEYMGILIGSSLLLFFLLYESLCKWKRIRVWVLVLLQIAVLVYLAAPGGGTNAGGTIAWIAAMVLMSRLLVPRWWQGRRILGLMLIVSILFFVFLLMQYFAKEQTHVGRLLHYVAEGGFEPFWDMLLRKMEMNARLIRSSTWSKLFVTSFVVILLYWLLPKIRKSKPASSQLWRQAFRTIVWVSLINLLVNDSGVVAAACSLLFAAVPQLHHVLKGRVTTARVPSSGSPTS